VGSQKKPNINKNISLLFKTNSNITNIDYFKAINMNKIFDLLPNFPNIFADFDV